VSKKVIAIFIFTHFQFQILSNSLLFTDAVTFLDVRLAQKAGSLCHWNIYDAGNSLMGFRLFIACSS
jgi:hypothetical protein